MPSTEGFTAIFVSSFVMMRQTKTRAGSQGARRRQEEEEKGDTLGKRPISQALKAQPPDKTATKERNNPKHRETQRKVINAA